VIHKLNPKMIVASIKGFGPGPYEDCKVYENVAQCTGGSASTTGFATARRWSPARRSAIPAPACIWRSASSARSISAPTGKGQKVTAAMQDGVLNLCRVKMRDQQRLAHGPLMEYSQFGEWRPFGEAVPRAGNDSGGGQPGWILKCKGWETDPNAYIYFITQAPVWEKICDVIGKPAGRPIPITPSRRRGCRACSEIFDAHRSLDHDQDQVRGDGHPQQVRHPLRSDPVDEGTRRGAVAARHRHRGRGRSPERGKYLSSAIRSSCRQPDRGDALAAAGRAHRRDPARQVLPKRKRRTPPSSPMPRNTTRRRRSTASRCSRWLAAAKR
jgi:hypothetical protein